MGRMGERPSAWPTCESMGLEPGQRWAFRLKTTAIDLAEVEIVRCGAKRPSRALVGFVAEEWEGRREWVAPTRLVCRWSEATEWTERASRWQRARVLSSSAPEIGVVAVDNVVATAHPDWDVSCEDSGSDFGLLIVRDVRSFTRPRLLDDLRAVEGAFTDGHSLVAPWPAAKLYALALAAEGDAELLRSCLATEDEDRSKAVLGDNSSERRYWPRHRTEREHFTALATAYDLIRSWWATDVVGKADEILVLRAEVERQRAQILRLLNSLRTTMERPLTERTFVSICEQLGAPDCAVKRADPFRYANRTSDWPKRCGESGELDPPVPEPLPPGTLTQREVADLIGVSRYAIRRWTAADLIPHFTSGGRWYSRALIEEWYVEERDTIARGDAPGRTNTVLQRVMPRALSD